MAPSDQPVQQSAADAVRLLHIHPDDNVVVAVLPLSSGEQHQISGTDLTVQQDVSLGAKLALVDLACGDKVIKFGEPIGSTTTVVPAGHYIHTHNLQSDYIPTASH